MMLKDNGGIFTDGISGPVGNGTGVIFLRAGFSDLKTS